MKARNLQIRMCPVGDIRRFVEDNHYSHSINGVKIKYCFRVDHQQELVGGVVFGAMSTTAWKKFSECEDEVLELRRLVLVDEAEKNSESRVIGFALREIAKLKGPEKVVVSYADPAHGHTGTIYRAANFEYVGRSGRDTGYIDKETGKVYHSRALRTRGNDGQYKPFVRRLRDKLDSGQLEKIKLPPKECFVYKLRK